MVHADWISAAGGPAIACLTSAATGSGRHRRMPTACTASRALSSPSTASEVRGRTGRPRSARGAPREPDKPPQSAAPSAPPSDNETTPSARLTHVTWICGKSAAAAAADCAAGSNVAATNAPSSTSDTCVSLSDRAVNGGSRTRRATPGEVEGLVGCESRGGSSPLRRTGKAPQLRAFSCQGANIKPQPPSSPNTAATTCATSEHGWRRRGDGVGRPVDAGIALPHLLRLPGRALRVEREPVRAVARVAEADP